MKNVYIVLTHTGTVLSTIIRYYTKDEFSHISISLDDELEEMYSFGRLNPYNPFWGGFVHENIKYGTFKRFKNTKTEVYSLLVGEEQYKRLEKVIKYFSENKEKYKFNTIGLFCVSLKKQIKRKNTFYCAEFVKHIMKFAGIPIEVLPSVIKPEDFKKLEGLHLEYQGLLRKYKKKQYPKLKDIIQERKISFV